MISIANVFIAVYGILSVAYAEVATSVAEPPTELGLDLNAATATLNVAKSSSAGTGMCTSTILAMMQLTVVVGCLAAVVATILSTDVLKQTSLHEFCMQARALMSRCLFLVLASLTNSPYSSSLQANAKHAPRANHSLDNKLDPVHLSFETRDRRSMSTMGMGNSMAMGNKLSAASLEAPLIDMLANTPNPFNGRASAAATPRRPRSRRSGSAGSLGQASCNATPRLPAAPSPIRDKDATGIRAPDGAVDRSGASAHPGRKPNLAKMREAKAAAEAKAVQEAQARADGAKPRGSKKNNKRDEEDGWSDDDWECEPRAPYPGRGLEMEGEDVGCLPSRVLRLPKPMVASRWGTSMYGRSIFTSDFEIPRVKEI